MGFGEADCSSPNVVTECSLLMNSEVSFVPLPQEKRLQLAFSNQLKVPLNLILQSGLCEISCEGGLLENCTTTKRHYYSQNVISPIHFENCSSQYHYCVIAQVGDCCPVCTQTRFMEDYQPETFSAPVSPWNITLAAFVTLVILAGLGAVIIYLYTVVLGEKAPKSVRAGRITHVPLQHKLLEPATVTADVTILCLYLKDESKSFFGNIRSLQSFLRSHCFNVIDIYSEEDTIDQSVYKWAQTHLRDHKTKLVLIDTDSLRSLWGYDAEQFKTRNTVEQAIVYLHSCIPLIDTYTQLFVVRFQDDVLSQEPHHDLSNGRSYMYPINGERLAEDLHSQH